MGDPELQSNGNQVESCERCALYRMRRMPGLLHYYDFTPLPEHFEGGTMYFNVTEVRLYLSQAETVIERYPYDEAFLSNVSLHEYVPGHVDHIPDDAIRPTLCGNVSVKRTGGIWQIATLILDGHHSAQKLIMQRKPVILQIVPSEVMDKLLRRSVEELMTQQVVVMEL